MITRKTALSLGLVIAAAIVLGVWCHCRTSWFCCVRLGLVLRGYPFAELRDEPPGARHPPGEGLGLGYGRSIYSGGRFVGVVGRFGSFEFEDFSRMAPRERWAFDLQYSLLNYAPYGACLLAGVGVWIFFGQRQRT